MHKSKGACAAALLAVLDVDLFPIYYKILNGALYWCMRFAISGVQHTWDSVAVWAGAPRAALVKTMLGLIWQPNSTLR